MNRLDEQEQLHAINIYTDYETTNFSPSPGASIVLEKEQDEPEEIEEITKLSLFDKVKSWYKPTYIKQADAFGDEKQKLRYCNGRMSKRKFVLLHCMTISTILNIILIPLTYFVFIPVSINHKVQTLKLSDINIDHMDVKEWRPDGLIFSWEAVMPKPFAFSIKTKLSALDLKIHDDHSNDLMTIKVPETEVNIGKPIVLEFEGEVILEEGLKDVIGRISQPGGLQGAVFTAETRISITLGGVTWYKHLKIKRDFKIPKLDGSLTSLLSIMPSNIMAKGLPGVTTGNNTETIEVGGVNVTFWQLLPYLPPISIKSLDVVFTDAGPNIILKMLLENPMVVSVPLPDMSFGLQLEGSYLSTANIKGFNIVRGLNDLEINLQLTFDQSRIVSPDQLSDSITEAAGKLFGVDKEGLKFNVIGPIELQNVNIIGDITEKLSLTLPIDDILNNANTNSLKNSLGANGLGSLLQAIHLSINAVGNQIVIPTNITLPSFLPLPPSFEFNYNTSFGVFKEEQNVLTIGISDILMTNVNEILTIKTTISVLPNNSSEASHALSSIVVPVLLGQASSLDVKNIKLTSNTGESFPWVDELFGKLTVHVPIPGLSTTSQ